MNKLILAAGITLLILSATFFLLSTENKKEKNIVDYQMGQKGSSIHFSSFQQTETSKENKNVSLQTKKTITAITSANTNSPEDKVGLPQNKMATNNGQQVHNTILPPNAATTPQTFPSTVVKQQKEDTQKKDYSQNEDEETGQKILSGWVFNETGQAVDNISVEATARYSNGDKQTTSTDSEGFFEFRQLENSVYHLRTLATDRYESAAAVLQAGTQTAVLVVREITDYSLTVYGVVENARSGEVLQGVRVEPTGQARQSISTDAQGRYNLQLSLDRQNEQVTLRYQLDGYQEGHFTLIGQQLAGVKETKVSIQLEPAAEQVSVVGTVQDSTGQPVKWASVHLYSPNSRQNAQTLTDTEGHFAFTSIPAGSDYRLWVDPKENYSDYIEENLVIRSNGLDLNIVLDPLAYGDLSGWMVDTEGKTVPNFSLQVRTDQGSSGYADVVTGDSRGHFILNNLPEGGVTLQTRSAPAFSFSGIKIVSDENTEVRLVFDTGDSKLEGFVLDSQGKRLALAKVRLTWLVNKDSIRNHSSRETVTDAAGYFLFMQLGLGTHELSISKEGYRPTRKNITVNFENKVIVLRLAKNVLQ